MGAIDTKLSMLGEGVNENNISDFISPPPPRAYEATENVSPVNCIVYPSQKGVCKFQGSRLSKTDASEQMHPAGTSEISD